MGRTTITASGLLALSTPIDQTNGMHLDLSQPGIGGQLEKGLLHLYFYNSAAGSHNMIIKAGYGPWASMMGSGDLTIAVSAGAILDVAPLISFQRHARDSFNSIDIDFDAGTTGSLILCWGFTQDIPANTAFPVVVKNSAGLLTGVVCTATGTAGLTVYDNAASGAGTALATISSNPTVGNLYSGQTVKAQKGIVALGVANCPACTVHYI